MMMEKSAKQSALIISLKKVLISLSSHIRKPTKVFLLQEVQAKIDKGKITFVD